MAFDGITGFSVVPLRLATCAGFGFSLLAFFAAVFILIQKIFFSVAVAGWASLSIIIFFIGGLQLLVLGVIGEYIGRIYIETQKRPLYVIEKSLDFKPKSLS